MVFDADEWLGRRHRGRAIVAITGDVDVFMRELIDRWRRAVVAVDVGIEVPSSLSRAFIAALAERQRSAHPRDVLKRVRPPSEMAAGERARSAWWYVVPERHPWPDYTATGLCCLRPKVFPRRSRRGVARVGLWPTDRL